MKDNILSSEIKIKIISMVKFSNVFQKNIRNEMIKSFCFNSFDFFRDLTC